MIRTVINNHLNFRQINAGLRKTIQNIPFLAFKKNKKLTRYCRDQTIKKGKVFETHSKNKKGEFEPCNTIKPLLCCK